MNKQVLAVIIGVIVVVVIGYFVWRLISSQIAGENDINDVSQQATAEQISESISSLEINEDSQAVLGQSVSIDRNRVVAEISDNIYWISPIAGDKNLILVNSTETNIAPNDVIAFTGEIVSIKEFSASFGAWRLTSGDLDIIRAHPFVIEATVIDLLE